MTAFHTIAIPHDDILQGCLTMDVFLAEREQVQNDVKKYVQQWR